MIIRIPFILIFLLSTSLWADYRKSYFCSETANIQAKALNSNNELAFSNPDGMKLGLIGTLMGMKDGIGACWWHSKMQRSSLYLAMFRPELPAPTNREQVVEMLDMLRAGRQVIEIPGYSNMREFSNAWASEFEEVITKWQKENTWLDATWTRALDASLNEKVNPEQLRERMELLYQRLLSGEVLFQHLSYLDELVVHSWLVIQMESIENGYRLTVLDSNQQYSYPVGSTGYYQVEYYYGDRYLSYRNNKLVPSFEPNEKEYDNLKYARDIYCQDVELIDISLPEISEVSSSLVVEKEELSEDDAYQLLYLFLTTELITYPEFIYIAHVLKGKDAAILRYFSFLVDKYEDLPAYLTLRMMYMLSEFKGIREAFESKILTIMDMASSSSTSALMCLEVLFGGGDVAKSMGVALLKYFDRFGLSTDEDRRILALLAFAEKQIDEADLIFDYLLSSDIVYTESDLIYLIRAMSMYEDVNAFYRRLLTRDEMGNNALLALIETTDSVLWTEIINHSASDRALLEHVIEKISEQWPAFPQSTQILEAIKHHPLFDRSLGQKVRLCQEALERKRLLQDIIDGIDLWNLNFSSRKNDSCQTKVTINAAELTVNNSTFVIEMGCQQPIEIQVRFLDLLRFSKTNTLELEFSAPAHFNYATEKELFNQIFRCGKRGCLEKFRGKMIVGKEQVEIFNTTGVNRSLLDIVANR